VANLLPGQCAGATVAFSRTSSDCACIGIRW
jgi:hypothetical protein